MSRPRARRAAAPAVTLLVLVALLAATVTGCSSRTGDGENPSGASTADAVSLDEGSAVALEALTDYARRDLSAKKWFAALEPVLSPGARAAYAGTDPRRLPEMVITGSPGLVGGGTATTLTISVNTSAGTYGVDLSRRSGDGPWVVQRFVPPGQESMYQ